MKSSGNTFQDNFLLKWLELFIFAVDFKISFNKHFFVIQQVNSYQGQKIHRSLGREKEEKDKNLGERFFVVEEISFKERCKDGLGVNFLSTE